jgi:hypothetical protein
MSCLSWRPTLKVLDHVNTIIVVQTSAISEMWRQIFYFLYTALYFVIRSMYVNYIAVSRTPVLLNYIYILVIYLIMLSVSQTIKR